MMHPTIMWTAEGVKLIDQTKLPLKFQYVVCRNVPSLWRAIKQLKVRGAPAIGVAAAFGVLLGVKSFRGKDVGMFKKKIADVSRYIASSRPTAVNLFNALHRMEGVIRNHSEASVKELKDLLKIEALKMYEEDRAVCRRMGAFGANLIKPNHNVLTICNAGALATVDYGTALGVMYSAKADGKAFKVYSCETRPLLQGARLTVWELLNAKIDTTLICDSMAATLMKQGKVDLIFTGADCIAANGDTANKIGTYNLAVLARYHKVPFYVVAPYSTFDLSIRRGQDIPIEERGREEVLGFGSVKTAPGRVNVYNPAFDVTDARLITAIITEQGLIYPPFMKSIKSVFSVNAKVNSNSR